VGVIEGERLVVVVDLRHVRVGEDVQQAVQLGAGFQLQLAVLQFPAAAPDLLVFPLLRIADAGLGFDVVEPGVFHALAVGPHVLAGHRTGVATDALVQVEDEGELRSDFHFTLLVGCVKRLNPPPKTGGLRWRTLQIC
jgi:hypothetical protein